MSQLDSQRTYFEEKVAQAADKAASALKDAPPEWLGVV